MVGNQLTGENQMFGTRILIGTMAGHVTMCTLNGVFVANAHSSDARRRLSCSCAVSRDIFSI